MSSKRHLRRKQCQGKYRHATYSAAMIHLRSHEARFKDRDLAPYLCRFCKGWHIGHPIGLKIESFRTGRRV